MSIYPSYGLKQLTFPDRYTYPKGVAELFVCTICDQYFYMNMTQYYLGCPTCQSNNYDERNGNFDTRFKHALRAGRQEDIT